MAQPTPSYLTVQLILVFQALAHLHVETWEAAEKQSGMNGT